MKKTYKKLIGTGAFVVITGVVAFGNFGFVQEAFSKAAINRAEVVAQQGNGYGQECKPSNVGNSEVIAKETEFLTVASKGQQVKYVIGGQTQFTGAFSSYDDVQVGSIVVIQGHHCENRIYPVALRVHGPPGQNK